MCTRPFSHLHADTHALNTHAFPTVVGAVLLLQVLPWEKVNEASFTEKKGIKTDNFQIRVHKTRTLDMSHIKMRLEGKHFRAFASTYSRRSDMEDDIQKLDFLC